MYVLYECVSLTFFDLLSQRKMKKALTQRVLFVCERDFREREQRGRGGSRNRVQFCLRQLIFFSSKIKRIILILETFCTTQNTHLNARKTKTPNAKLNATKRREERSFQRRVSWGPPRD